LLGVNTVSKRYFLAALAVCVSLIAAICFGLDCYLGRSGVREQLEAAAQRETGGAVKIGAIHYGFLSGLRATDIKVTTVADGAHPSSFSLPSIAARVAWRPLFSGRVVIKRLVIQKPSFVLVQNADGGWDLPLPQKPKEPIQRVPGPGESAPKGPEFPIQAVTMENARFGFVERDGRELGVLEGVTVQVVLEGPNKAAGSIVVHAAKLRSGLSIEAFRTPFEFQGTSLTLSPIGARLAEGGIRGAATLGMGPGQPPFTLDLLFDGVNLQRLLTQLGEKQKDRRIAGTHQGNLDLYGRVGDKFSLGGSAQVRLRGGRMDQVPLVQLIGSALQMEVSDIELRQAQLDLRASEGKLFVDSLLLESPSIRINAKGTSALDGKLDLAARLAVHPKLSRKLPGGDWRDIGFAVTGTLARPETDLLQVMVGQRIGNQFMNLLQSVAGKHKKKSGDKKKSEPVPSPAEEEEGMSPAAAP